MMDISETIAPKSDQLNYDDLIAGDMTVTISEIRKGTPDQPVELHLAETPGRPYKPGKSMRRVLVRAWGKDGQAYVGRRLALYGDPSVKWAGKAVGGIRIKALSDIDAPVTVELTVTRGKREPFTVKPLTASEPAPESITAEQWQAIVSAAQEKGMDAQAVAAEVAGRELSSPRELTGAEAERIMGRINEHSG